MPLGILFPKAGLVDLYPPFRLGYIQTTLFGITLCHPGEGLLVSPNAGQVGTSFAEGDLSKTHPVDVDEVETGLPVDPFKEDITGREVGMIDACLMQLTDITSQRT